MHPQESLKIEKAINDYLSEEKKKEIIASIDEATKDYEDWEDFYASFGHLSTSQVSKDREKPVRPKIPSDPTSKELKAIAKQVDKFEKAQKEYYYEEFVIMFTTSILLEKIKQGIVETHGSDKLSPEFNRKVFDYCYQDKEEYGFYDVAEAMKTIISFIELGVNESKN